MRYLFLLLFLISASVLAQDEHKTNGFYYKIGLGATLKVNEHYTVNTDDEETLLVANALILNNNIGYQFDERSAFGLNAEYSHYIVQGYRFLPVYVNFKYNVFDFDDLVFIRGGYGKLVQFNQYFESGTTYLLGLGVQIFDKNFRNSFLFGLDFQRKRFGFKQSEKLSSLALSFEFMLF